MKSWGLEKQLSSYWQSLFLQWPQIISQMPVTPAPGEPIKTNLS